LEPRELMTLFGMLPFSSVKPRGRFTKQNHAVAESGTAIAGTGGGGPAAHERLPDLTVWASPEKGYLYDWRVDDDELLMPGRTLLRLSNAVANVGKGPMELRGGAVTPEGDQEVFQRIYGDNGTFTDRLAGAFEYHPVHAHIHFEDFATYNLRAVTEQDGVGDVVATGDKVSFCLLDVMKYEGPVKGTRRPEHFDSCGQVQGISVGWSDVYDSGLADQWIDITDVPDGEYWLESVVDPSDRIVELDETNNVARIRIHLGEPPADDFPNTFDDPPTIDLSAKGSGIQAGRVEQSGDVDVFTFIAPRKGKMKITQTRTVGPIDSVLSVYDSAGQLLAQNDDAAHGLDSRVRIRVTPLGRYFIKAAGFGNTTGDYLLSVSTNRR
jgi:hypothetical protein